MGEYADYTLEHLTKEEADRLGRLTGINAYHKFPKDHEYLWERVKREREEEHPKYKGGQCREVQVDLTRHFLELQIRSKYDILHPV